MTSSCQLKIGNHAPPHETIRSFTLQTMSALVLALQTVEHTVELRVIWDIMMFMCVVNPSIDTTMFICWCEISLVEWLATETEIPFWWDFRHFLHRKLSKWRLPGIAELWDYHDYRPCNHGNPRALQYWEVVKLQRIYHVYPSPVSLVWTLYMWIRTSHLQTPFISQHITLTS